MRHVRKLGLCLVAACAVAALGATSALAIKNPTRSIGIYKNCPVHSELNGFRDAACVFAATEIGEKGTSAGGKFTVGPITTPIEKQITLQYGDNEHEVEGAEFGVVEEVIAPTDGAEIIVPTPEKVPGEPIGHVTATEQEELGWPATLKYSYATHKSQEKHVTETIELAGLASSDKYHCIFEENTDCVTAPIKIKAGNQWLSDLGDVCYVGSNEEPIVQHLTTGETESPLTGEKLHGSGGELAIFDQGNALYLHGSVLYDNRYAVPAAKCTGPYAEAITNTINRKFGLPAPAGASVTEIKGTLYDATPEIVEQRDHL